MKKRKLHTHARTHARTHTHTHTHTHTQTYHDSSGRLKALKAKMILKLIDYLITNL